MDEDDIEGFRSNIELSFNHLRVGVAAPPLDMSIARTRCARALRAALSYLPRAQGDDGFTAAGRVVERVIRGLRGPGRVTTILHGQRRACYEPG